MRTKLYLTSLRQSLPIALVIMAGCSLPPSSQVNQNKLLFEAVRKNDLTKISLLIKAGVNVNAKDSDGLTALMIASFNGHLEIVRLLLKGGADVNAKNKHGATALSTARLGEQIDIVNELIKAEAKE